MDNLLQCIFTCSGLQIHYRPSVEMHEKSFWVILCDFLKNILQFRQPYGAYTIYRQYTGLLKSSQMHYFSFDVVASRVFYF